MKIKGHTLSNFRFCFYIILIAAFIFPSPAIAETQKKVKKIPARLVEDGDVAFELDFESFEKERDFLDEPFDFSSAEAEELWKFLVSKNLILKRPPKI